MNAVNPDTNQLSIFSETQMQAIVLQEEEKKCQGS